jgi:glycosyltransferase involved in cell wall biosynthesis
MARLQAASAVCDLIGIEYSGTDKTYAWNRVAGDSRFPRIVLFPDDDIDDRPRREVALRISQVLDQVRPDIMAIPGWSSIGALVTLEWCLRHSTPAVLMSDSTAQDFPRRPWRELIKRRLVALYSSSLTAGKPHIEYLTNLGIPKSKIFTGYDVVDNAHFAHGAALARSQKELRRVHLGLPEHFFLAPCRFIPEKNLANLIAAFADYRSSLGDRAWSLVLLGDGTLRTELIAQCQDLGINDCVKFTGFRQYDELPGYYGLAGAVILPSVRDTWGLVINEAMASGLPVLVSERCGCSADLVEDGVNGYVFDPHDTKGMASLMKKISHGGLDLAAMGHASQSIVDRWTPQVFAEGLLQASHAASEGPLKGTTLAGKALLWALINRPL